MYPVIILCLNVHIIQSEWTYLFNLSVYLEVHEFRLSDDSTIVKGLSVKPFLVV